MTVYVCAVDGVPVTASRTGKYVHTDEVPAGTPDHELINAMDQEVWRVLHGKTAALKGAIADMLLHHGSVCPLSTCEHAQSLSRAAKGM